MVGPWSRTAWAIQLVAHKEDAERISIEFGLDGLVGDGAGTLHAIDSVDQFSRVARYPGGLGEWPIGAGLNHPKIGICSPRLPQRIIDHAAINAGNDDDDAKQQAQAEVRQHKAQEIVLDVAIREVHRFGSLAILAVRPVRMPLRSWDTTIASAATPPVIS